VKRWRFFLRVVITVIGLTPSTRAVSRMPLPLSAISIIYCLTSGTHPVLRYCSKKNPTLAGGIIAPITLFAIGLLPIFHDLRASALRTLHCDNRYTPSSFG
jgi:hypothetical protein